MRSKNDPGNNPGKIKAIITGATGMVGKGVLLECLEDPNVESVLVITRSSTGISHDKMREVIHADFHDLSSVQHTLHGYNACFFCLGVSALGMSEAEYSRITYDLTTNFARILLDHNPDMVFVYVSGAGTDSSEQGRLMWARIKGKTENAILRMGFRDAYAFRPGVILPEKGVTSKTGWYNTVYKIMRPLFPLLKRLDSITTTEKVGRAMIRVAREGYTESHLENRDINRVAVEEQA